MSSDLARTIHTIAKQLHAADQNRAAEQSAARLYISHEEEGVHPEEHNGYCSVWDIHKTVDGIVQMSPAKHVRNQTNQPSFVEGYNFHTYNQAVGEYIAGHFLCYEGAAPPGVIVLHLRKDGSTVRKAALYLRCTAETLARSIHTIMQAYLAGSFV